jgi:hypothetical protein
MAAVAVTCLRKRCPANLGDRVEGSDWLGSAPFLSARGLRRPSSILCDEKSVCEAQDTSDAPSRKLRGVV